MPLKLEDRATRAGQHLLPGKRAVLRPAAVPAAMPGLSGGPEDFEVRRLFAPPCAHIRRYEFINGLESLWSAFTSHDAAYPNTTCSMDHLDRLDKRRPPECVKGPLSLITVRCTGRDAHQDYPLGRDGPRLERESTFGPDSRYPVGGPLAGRVSSTVRRVDDDDVCMGSGPVESSNYVGGLGSL